MDTDWKGFTTLAVLAISCWQMRAAEGPYFVTYTHRMEEQGNLDLETRSVLSKPGGGNRFLGAATEFEYGVAGVVDDRNLS